ncbi:hypothetical protein [Coleofasciculus sp. FACHB-129]|uniref:hypothetical protein n=1 Tax=Cyanophyceae TaxID=3028117 RepID=UPI001682D892|nr:hypothetical protein [Coleofasciculus sp. FACHB-129]MBD1893154.1 hypothetical protein [Coleofasciculus sp. FACHB-129]
MSDRLSQFLFISFHSQLHHCRAPSYVGQVVKPGYDDVKTDRTPVRSPVEKCMYDDLEENPLSTPTEDCSFIDKNS